MYGDITTRQQRMSRVDWKKIGFSFLFSMGKILLIVVSLYVFALMSYVVSYIVQGVI